MADSFQFIKEMNAKVKRKSLTFFVFLAISPALAEISCIFNRDKKIGVFNASLNGPLFDDEPTAPVKAKLSDEDKDITASVKEGFFRRLFRK